MEKCANIEKKLYQYLYWFWFCSLLTEASQELYTNSRRQKYFYSFSHLTTSPSVSDLVFFILGVRLKDGCINEIVYRPWEWWQLLRSRRSSQTKIWDVKNIINKSIMQQVKSMQQMEWSKATMRFMNKFIRKRHHKFLWNLTIHLGPVYCFAILASCWEPHNYFVYEPW